MNTMRFDQIGKLFSQRRLTRRQAIYQSGTGLAVAGLAAVGVRATLAQDATPAATPALPADPLPSADAATTHPEYLFVQTFDAGTWVPKAGVDGTYSLTLTGAAAQTTYFSDRPEREVGLAPNQKFLEGLGFTPANPPNAALVVTPVGSDEQDVLVIELLAPVFDADNATLTYDAKVLGDYGRRGLASLARQQTDYELASSFGEGSLFIDDCLDSTNDACWVNSSNPYSPGTVTSGNCWNSGYTGDFGCSPCEPYGWLCDDTYPNDCNGNCVDDIYRCGWAGCTG